MFKYAYSTNTILNHVNLSNGRDMFVYSYADPAMTLWYAVAKVFVDNGNRPMSRGEIKAEVAKLTTRSFSSDNFAYFYQCTSSNKGLKILSTDKKKRGKFMYTLNKHGKICFEEATKHAQEHYEKAKKRAAEIAEADKRKLKDAEIEIIRKE